MPTAGENRVKAGTNHNANHETCKHHSKRKSSSSGHIKDWSPHEHENVHTRLQDRLHDAKHKYIRVFKDDPDSLHAGAGEVALPVSIVLLPSIDDHDAAHRQGDQSYYERCHGPIA